MSIRYFQLKAVYADLDNFCALPEGCQAQYLRNPISNHGYVKPGMEQFDETKKVSSLYLSKDTK